MPLTFKQPVSLNKEVSPSLVRAHHTGGAWQITA